MPDVHSRTARAVYVNLGLMILPGTYPASLILLIFAFLCWGSWANTFKATQKNWRFELYYFDFAIGAMLAAIVAALTVGTLGWDGFSFFDDLFLAGKRQDVFVVAAGVVFNLGNMLIVAAISVAGLSLAFPIGLGMALIIAAIWNITGGVAGITALRFAGAGAILIAIVFAILAYRATKLTTLVERMKEGRTRSTKKVISMKGAALALGGGVFAGSFYPLLRLGQQSEIGLGPYSAGFLFALGILVSTFAFSAFFMNLPVQGEPVDVTDYFKGKAIAHMAGILGGIIWYAGTIAIFVVAKAQGAAQITPALSFGLTGGAVVPGALWGLFFWKELKGKDPRVNYYVGVMLVVLVAGVALLSGGQTSPR